MKKYFVLFLTLGLMVCLCSCGSGSKQSGDKEYPETLPEDNGGMTGVYKWVEMADNDVDAYLVIWDDGIGVIDMLGVVETVKYDDDTMQSSGEGALPQKYTFKDGTLTWTAIGDDEGQISTFVKLTPEELSRYQETGIGNTE